MARLMTDLADAGVTLHRRGDQLQVQAPQGALDAALVARLREAKEALLSVLDDEGARAAPLAPALPGEAGDAAALSPGQARLVAATRLGDPAMYNEQAAIELADAVDEEAVARAFAALARRHDILRTVFSDGEPELQRVLPEPLVALQAWAVDGDDALRARAAELARQPFAAGAPMWRVDLFSTPERVAVLVLTIHHAIFDRWSMSVLIRDFSAYLASPDAAEPSAPRLSYRDYAAWQRRWMASPDYAAQLDAWTEALAEVDEVPAIRGDRARPPALSGRGGTERFEIPAACMDAAAAFSRGHNTTLFTTLFSAFALLQQRYTGEARGLTLTPAANRPFQAAEDIAGYFVNLVALATEVGEGDSFGALVDRVRDASAQAFARQGVPLDAIVERLRARGGPRHEQLAQTVFAFQNVRLPAVRTASGAAVPFDLDSPFARFDLYLSIEGDERGTFAVWQYNTDLYDAATIRQLGEHYLALLRAALAAPDADARGLPILSEAEEARLRGWGRHERPYRADAAIDALFRECAAAHPGRVALEQGGERWTYAELDQWSDRAAGALRAAGVEAGAVVGVAGERSPRLLAAFLAALKAGAAYLPLDPTYPAARLSAMTADAAPALMIVADGLDAGWLGDYAGPVLSLADCEAGDARPLSSAARRAEDLAYVMYTSGSTGRPKGVAVPHRAVVRLAVGGGYARLDASTVMLQQSPLGFDASTFEIWGCWLNGGRLVLAEPGMPFLDAASRDGVTTMWLTADLFRMMVEEEPAALGGLRELLTGGDALPVASCRAFLEACPGVALINGYGPTENTTFTCSHRVTAGDVKRGSIPIGRPIGNTEVRVVDAGGRLVPVGVPGELWAGGDGLALGYLGRADLTAERFVAAPPPDGGRWYRTGDRVRWRRDGALEFLGRVDEQIKLRGYRIELGEIEATLGHHPGLSGCAVALRRSAADEKQLVGYLVARQDSAEAADAAAVQAWLETRLPGYMVPRAWVWLDALPQSANGKVDRKRLPEPQIEAGAAAAENAAEAALVEIWQGLLGLERVGVRDNFFALGGDSILSIQMASRAAERGLRISPQQVFRYPTIAELAAESGAAEETGAPAEQGEVRGEVRPGPIQAWYLDWPGTDWQQFSQGAYLGLSGPLDAEALIGALQAVAQRHDALRIGWRRDGERWIQESGAGAPAEVKIADLRGLADAEAALERDAAELQAGLRLDGAGLWAARLYRLDQGWRLLWLAHHASVDGVSWRILLEDLWRAYAALSRGEAMSWPAKTVSYQAWSQRLWAWADSLPESTLDYWREMDAPGMTLPGVGAGEDTVAAESRVSLQWDAATTERWLRQAGEAYRMRPEELLLAALARALRQWTGAEECVLDLEGHGRDGLAGVDVSRTVGWFTSLYPLRLPLSGDLPRDLKSVKERMRGVPDSGIAYQALRYGGRGSELGGHARTVCFNYLGQWRLEEGGAPGAAWLGEPPGGARSGGMRRRYALDVVAQVHEGRLRVDWLYNAALQAADAMTALAERFRAELDAVLAHCLSPQSGGLTPSDLPLAQLEQSDIDAIEREHPGLEALYGVTPLQQGILFHSIADEDAPLYIEQLHWKMSGVFDAERFRQAWFDVAAAHAALRTTFRWRQLQSPVQIVHPRLDPDWDTLDWRALSAEACVSRFDALRELDRQRGFDLEHGPLLRGTLIREPGDAWRFLWSYHHAVVDGWSVPLILKQVIGRYAELGAGDAAPLPGSRFLPFVNWLAARDESEQAAYWQQVLAGIEEPTPIGFAAPARGAQARGQGRRAFVFDAGLNEQVDRAARRAGVTRASLLTGAWALTLGYAGGGREVVFGTTLSGRPATLPGVERMVGLFINTVPVRVGIDDDARVSQWLQQLHGQQSERARLGAASLTDIRRWAGYEGGELLSSLFVVENYPVDRQLARGDAGFDVSEFAAAETRTNYPLVGQLIPGEETVLYVDFDASRYDEEGIGRLGASFLHLLAQLAAQPDARLGDLSLVDEAEARRLIHDWNATPPVGDGYLLHAGIERHAELTPLAPAIIGVDEAMNYRELADETLRVARAVAAAGARREPVAVLLPRSARAVAAYSGVMRAGCAYVPADPAMPPGRLRDLLATVGHVLTTREHLPLLDCVAARAILIDETPPAEVALPEAAPDDLAYVMFTSGSTGKPKGVMISHRAAALTMEVFLRRYEIGASDRLMCVSAAGFDLSVFDFFGAFAAGAAVLLAPESSTIAPAAWLDLMAREGATVWESVPAVMELLLLECRQSGRALPPSLKLAMLSGDRVPVGLPAQIRAAATSDPEVLALGGATEAAIWSCWYDTRGLAADAAFVPYGRHLPGQRLYVLSSSLQAVPVGVPGDLWIAGAGVALGYLGQPDLTAYRFVDNPFVPGERMYRTGDRARALADGNLEFLGRVDDQVKIGGFRIEIGEIEAALAAAPGVERGVASVVERDGRRIIAGYVLLLPGASLDSAAIRDALARRLPPYMLPASIMALDSVPLSANGKVDRKRLPEPQIEAGAAAAENAAEAALVEIWQGLLGLERVGVRDNFFALGGDSILSIQMASRAAERGLRISPQQVFRYPTIAELAAESGAAEETGAPAEQGEVRGEVRPGPIQAWYLDWPGMDWQQFSQGAYLGLSGPLDAEALIGALQAVAQRHDALRIGWRRDGERWIQESGAGAPAEVKIADLRGLADAEAALERDAAELQAGLRLDGAGLWAARLYRLEQGWRLLWLAHHASVDGVSWRILLADLWRAYAALSRGEAMSWPAKTVSYQAWSQRLWAWADSLPESTLDYWREMDAPGMTLPGVGAGEDTVAAESRVSLQWDAATTERWLRQAGEAYRMRPEELLLAALARALRQWTGAEECVLDLEGHGRDGLAGVDVSRTVGWFTSLYPLRLPLSGDLPRDLKSVKERMRGVPDSGIAYQALRYGGRGSELGGHARTVCFNYLGQWRLEEGGAPGAAWLGEPPGGARSGGMRRRYALDVVAQVHEGRLRVDWLYNAGLQAADAMTALAERFRAELDAVLTHCLSPQSGGLTPSDLPLAHLDQNDIDEVLQLLNEQP
ncbi:non-ribosomal peptide synthetase [Chromobacterium rhizoryzae]|uniref:non-ribosomal peptide synthetase n=1 Tax=Chromobacterium rhizoryzae TaxID=1778675 RepID=UPI001D09389F|nr:non-ribosomal peptide synthetase [Chromobacterium rhizoryzae]